MRAVDHVDARYNMCIAYSLLSVVNNTKLYCANQRQIKSDTDLSMVPLNKTIKVLIKKFDFNMAGYVTAY